jgi:hypothetical protein
VTKPLEYYDKRFPEPRNALDLFRDQWTTEIEGTELSRARLADDDRVRAFLKHYGSVEGKAVLKLGPLEGGHSKMLAERMSSR